MSSVVLSAYYSDKELSISNHYHDCHQIIYVTDGEINITINGNNTDVKKGTLILFNRLTEHSINSASLDYKRYIMKVSPFYNRLPDFSDKLFFHMFSNVTNVHTLSIREKETEITNLLKALSSECTRKETFFDPMADYLFSQFLVLVYRLHPELHENISEENFDIIRKIQHSFEAHPEKQYTLCELAQMYNMSSSSISHKFKKIMGTSVIDYLKHVRIANAKKLLTHSEIPISEVIELCGFSDASNFSRTFKNVTGLTPSAFRCNYSF